MTGEQVEGGDIVTGFRQFDMDEIRQRMITRSAYPMEEANA